MRALIDRLRAGEEIIIESGDEPVAILRVPERQKARTLSTLVARLEEQEKELGHPLIMDEDYAQDMLAFSIRFAPKSLSIL